MSHFLYDGPPTVAEMTGLRDLAVAAAEQAEYEGDFRIRERLIAQGRIKPAGKPDGLRATLIAQGQIWPADPREVAEVYRVKLTGARFAPTGNQAEDRPWFGDRTGFPLDEYGYEM